MRQRKICKHTKISGAHGRQELPCNSRGGKNLYSKIYHASVNQLPHSCPLQEENIPLHSCNLQRLHRQRTSFAAFILFLHFREENVLHTSVNQLLYSCRQQSSAYRFFLMAVFSVPFTCSTYLLCFSLSQQRRIYQNDGYMRLLLVTCTLNSQICF